MSRKYLQTLFGLSLLGGTLLVPSSCAKEPEGNEDPSVSRCTEIARDLSFESLYVQMIRKSDADGMGIDDDVLRQFAQEMIADPTTRSMEFQSCLMNKGYKCLPTHGIDAELAAGLLALARSSGWLDPEENTCLSSAGEVVNNPFTVP